MQKEWNSLLKDRLVLPKRGNLKKFENKDLERLSKLVYHRAFGLFYRSRYKMANRLLINFCDRALEIGFGSGLFIPTLSRKCNFVYGVDIHNEIDKTNEMLEKEGTTNFFLLNADIYGIPFKKEVFDLVICLSILEHLEELDIALKEINRILKENGRIIIGFPIKNKLTKMLFNLLGYRDEEIHPSGQLEIFKSCFKKLTLEESILYPRIPGIKNSLYFVGRFRKKCIV